jgi:hypothetical protein
MFRGNEALERLRQRVLPTTKVPLNVKKPCPLGSGLLVSLYCQKNIWFRGQDLNLRPADLAGDCAATAERISGYGPKDAELPRQQRHRHCASEVIMYW